MTKKDKQTKGRVVELTPEFNRKLKMRVLELAEIGINKTVSELIVHYAEIGYNSETINK